MEPFLGSRFAPVTSAIGYLEVDLDDAVAALAEWRRELFDEVSVADVPTLFPDCLYALEPLVGGARPRELLVQATGGWTAYFDCLLQGTDAVSAVGYLAGKLSCRGLAIRAARPTRSFAARGHEFSALQFELFGDERTDFLNYVRTISLTHDGTRWRFDLWGEAQPFEESEKYRSRRLADRFTGEMLERYCRALGIEPFTAVAYGPRATIVHTALPTPPGALVMTIDDAQAWLGIKR